MKSCSNGGMSPSNSTGKSSFSNTAPASFQILAGATRDTTVWLTTHRQADGDGLACEAAFAAALRSQGINFKTINFEAPGTKYQFLFDDTSGQPVPVTIFDPDFAPKKPDLIVVFDTNDMRLLEPLSSWANEHGVPRLIIDHHEELPASIASSLTETWVDKKAASSGEVLLSLLDQLGWTIDSSIATRLYASLVFDTQNFRFIRASANSHTIAARLLPLVKDPERIHEYLLANLTPSKLGFMAQGLSRMRIEAEGRLAVVVLERDIFHRYGADPSDSGDVVDMALNVHSVKIAMLLREEAPGRWKVSLRSKKGFSVLEAAENVFGGGHRNAAGATVTWESLATKTNAAPDPSASNLPVAIEARLKPLLLEEIRRNM